MPTLTAPDGTSRGGRWGRTLAPLRERDFALLWIGECISSFGGPFQAIAVLFLLIHRGSSPLLFGAILAAVSIARTVGGFVAGPICDRYSRVLVLFAANLAGLVASALVFLFALVGGGLWLLLALLVVQAAAGGVYVTAMSAIAPSVLPADKLQAGNALIEMLSQLPGLLGAPLAGVLSATAGETTAIGVNTVSYAFAVVAGWRVLRRHRRPAPEKAPRGPSLLTSVREGLTAVARVPWLRTLILVDLLASGAAAGSMVVALPLYAEDLGGADVYGVLVATFALGSIVATIWYGGAGRHGPNRGALVCATLLAQGLLLAVLGPLPAWLAGVDLALVGASNGVAAIAFAVLVQTRVEDQMLGRVFAMSATAQSVAAPLGHLLAAALISVWGTSAALAVTGLAVTAAAAAGLLNPSVWQAERIGEPRP